MSSSICSNHIILGLKSKDYGKELLQFKDFNSQIDCIIKYYPYTRLYRVIFFKQGISYFPEYFDLQSRYLDDLISDLCYEMSSKRFIECFGTKNKSKWLKRIKKLRSESSFQ